MLISNQNSKSYYSKTCRAPIFQWKAPKKSPCRLFAPATARNRRIPCPIRRIADENKQRKQFLKKNCKQCEKLKLPFERLQWKIRIRRRHFLTNQTEKIWENERKPWRRREMRAWDWEMDTERRRREVGVVTTGCCSLPKLSVSEPLLLLVAGLNWRLQTGLRRCRFIVYAR